MSRTDTLAEAARCILLCRTATEKAEKASALQTAWQAGGFRSIGRMKAPARPGRPEKPKLCPAREVPRRRISRDPQGRIALLHALAHIELNAIDLAADILIRFPEEEMPSSFHEDWVKVCAEEGKHFLALNKRLGELEANYGDLPAHDGLWQAAIETQNDLLVRLAVVPLVLEARGLDVTPAMIEKLEAVGDTKSAAVLRVIYQDEIGHVAIGKRWFDYLAKKRHLKGPDAWQKAVKDHYRGALKRPFNFDARKEAGFDPSFYEPLADVSD
ncbi:MAG: ferritin-like domain-containing protein [Kiloniellales bacterium]|nr:ferritin-like domain-containing protein [Kiloniellales bacterium]